MNIAQSGESVYVGQIRPVGALEEYTGIYFLYVGQKLVYIGQAINVPSRIRDHERNKNFTHYSWIHVPAEDLNEEEARLIVLLGPSENKNLPRNSRYLPLRSLQKLCWRQYGRHAHVSEFQDCVVNSSVKTSDGQPYYDVQKLTATMNTMGVA